MIHSINIYVITVQLLIPSTCMHLRERIKIIYYHHLFCIFSIMRDNVKILTWAHERKRNLLFYGVDYSWIGEFCIKVNSSNVLNHINLSIQAMYHIHLQNIWIISIWACQIGKKEKKMIYTYMKHCWLRKIDFILFINDTF